jgi:hypothetical protein
LVGEGLRGNTHKTYTSAQRKYLNFCIEFNLRSLPATDTVLIQYVAFLFNKGLKGSTIKVYLSAVRSLHVFSNLPPPVHSEKLLLALKGASKMSSPPDRKLPITYQLLSEMLPYLEGRHDELLLKTVMCTTFFGCFRAGEVCLPDKETFSARAHLTYGDVTFDAALSTVTLHLKQSKTDTLNQGVHVKIGCSGTLVCAYCLLQRFIDQHPCPMPHSPLFVDNSMLILRKSYLISTTKLVLALMGYDPSKYSGHSYRAGSATTGAAAGFSAWELKMLGRWSSNAYQLYLRKPELASAFAQRLTLTE